MGRYYRGDVPKDAPEIFLRKMLEKSDTPVFQVDDVNYICVRKNGLFFLCTTVYNVSPAFVIELLFDWPELAAFAFWEELLPFSDFLPTATIGWALVVTGTRTRLTRADWNSLKPPPPKPPLADLRSYEPFGGEDSAHLRPGSTPWE